MRAVRGVWAAGLAVVLLASGCSGQPKVAMKDLVSDDPAVRSAAAVRLGQAQSKEAVDALIASLDDPEETVRVNVIRALSDIGDPKAIPGIVACVADRQSAVRMAACQALGVLKDPRGLPALEKALSDQDESVRIVAARSAGQLPGPESLEVLLRVALQDASERIRGHVVRVVGERRAREAVPRLESALRAESDLVRANAAMSLGELGDRSSLPVLFRSLDDPFYKVRCLSAHAIARIAPGDADAKAAVAKRLEVEDSAMARVDLAWALGSLGDRSRMETLRTLLFRGEPEDVRAEAAIALGELGDASELPVLERALADKMGIVRSRVAEAIDKIKGLKAA
jgi:HEAT repeat protein